MHCVIFHSFGFYPPCYAHDNCNYNGNLYGSNYCCNKDMRKLLSTWDNIKNTKVCLFTVLSSISWFTPEKEKEHLMAYVFWQQSSHFVMKERVQDLGWKSPVVTSVTAGEKQPHQCYHCCCSSSGHITFWSLKWNLESRSTQKSWDTARSVNEWRGLDSHWERAEEKVEAW